MEKNKKNQELSCDHNPATEKAMYNDGYCACFICPICKKKVHCNSCHRNWQQKGLMYKQTINKCKK